MFACEISVPFAVQVSDIGLTLGGPTQYIPDNLVTSHNDTHKEFMISNVQRDLNGLFLGCFYADSTLKIAYSSVQ